MALSSKFKKILEVAFASKPAKDELISALGGLKIQKAIVATSVSTTVDFAELKVGDLIVAIPAVAGDSMFEVCVTAKTKPSAAVVGDLYLVLRAV